MIPKKWWQLLLLAGIVFSIMVVGLVGLAATLIYPELPSLEALTDYKPKLPLRVYSEDGYLIGEFGEERRAFVTIDKVPAGMKSAILAIEDRRFYQHGGIDYHGIARAAFNNITGKGHEGASTITTQVAKNFFSHGERNLQTKIYEFCLAVKIEHALPKDKILELYINQIYLGQRAYGFEAASRVYFGKPLSQLNLAESALLAGLPKAPSGYNPFVHPKQALRRQHEVLHDMFRFGFIDEKTYEAAKNMPLRFKASQQSRDLAADYVAEIVRSEMYNRYQDAIYSSGLKVYTTIIKANQEAANAAVLQGIMDYDARHGYRGPEKYVKPTSDNEDGSSWMDKALDEIDTFSVLLPAIVTHVDPKIVKVHAKSGDDIEITGDGLSLVQKTLTDKDPEKRTIKAGAVVRIMKTGETWKLVQLPEVESALVATDPNTGAVRALVGGFDFNRNKFNHATQAWRQPGSSFKPFIYSAALEKGYTPATMIDDEPIYLSAEETGSGSAWEPHNFDNKYEGPMKMRTALTKSKNMVSIRILQSIGVSYAQDYITKFGFNPKDHPPYLAMALGAGSVTAWQMSGAYSVFANGGYKVTPYLISKVVNSQGKVLEQAKVLQARNNAPRTVDGRNTFIMTSMMQDVTRIGTAAQARQLGRNDLAGKTGTTNNQVDTWFAGYNPNQVAIVWMGFDKPRTLGKNETGGHAALPIWINYMAQALKPFPDKSLEVPEGVTSIKIDPATGIRAADDASGVYEYFYHEFPPPSSPDEVQPIPGQAEPEAHESVPHESPQSQPTVTDQLF